MTIVINNKKYPRGTRFINIKYNEEYILAAVGYNQNRDKVLVTLISLEDGNRYTDPIEADSPVELTLDEMNKLTSKAIFEEVSNGESK